MPIFVSPEVKARIRSWTQPAPQEEEEQPPVFSPPTFEPQTYAAQDQANFGQPYEPAPEPSPPLYYTPPPGDPAYNEMAPPWESAAFPQYEQPAPPPPDPYYEQDQANFQQYAPPPMFNPNVQLDPSQVEDRRGLSPNFFLPMEGSGEFTGMPVAGEEPTYQLGGPWYIPPPPPSAYDPMAPPWDAPQTLEPSLIPFQPRGTPEERAPYWEAYSQETGEVLTPEQQRELQYGSASPNVPGPLTMGITGGLQQVPGVPNWLAEDVGQALPWAIPVLGAAQAGAAGGGASGNEVSPVELGSVAAAGAFGGLFGSRFGGLLQNTLGEVGGQIAAERYGASDLPYNESPIAQTAAGLIGGGLAATAPQWGPSAGRAAVRGIDRLTDIEEGLARRATPGMVTEAGEGVNPAEFLSEPGRERLRTEGATARQGDYNPSVPRTLYRAGDELPERGPVFLTPDESAAREYTFMKPGSRVDQFVADIKNPADYNDLEKVVESLGYERIVAQVPQHSPFDGENLLDTLYVPEVRDALRKMGFDGFEGDDPLFSDAIPVVVAFDRTQLSRQVQPPPGGASSEIRPMTYDEAVGEVLSRVKDELRIRLEGIAEAEIGAGRTRQAAGIAGAIRNTAGMSIDEQLAAMRAGARTGTLRQTFARPLELLGEQKTAIVDEVNRRALANNRSFEALNFSVAFSKLLNGEGLQSGEIKLMGRYLGPEVEKAIDAINLTRPKATIELTPDDLAKIEQARSVGEASIRRAEIQAQRYAEKVQELTETSRINPTDRRYKTAIEDARARSLEAQNRADRLERDLIRRDQDALTARRAKEAEAQSEKDYRAETRAADLAERKNPGTQALVDKAFTKLGEAPAQSSALNRESVKIVETWLADNRRLLDALPEDGARLRNQIQARITGDLADSYLTSVVARKDLLEKALVDSGIEPKIAGQVADLASEAELKRRYVSGVPDDVKAQLKLTKGLEYGQASVRQGIADASSEMKEWMFGLADVGVFGQQFLKAIGTGGVQTIAGLTNRILTALHFSILDEAALTRGLPKRLAYRLDSLGVGANTGARDIDAMGRRTLLERTPVLGRVVGAMTDFQFRTVLGKVRELQYEGNLVLAHVAGKDVTNPAVRARAAAWANAATSYSRPALKTERALTERGLLVSPSMRRAQANQIILVAKAALNPKASLDMRLQGLATVASVGGGMILAGKLLNDYVGITEFEVDPSKPGFGNITLPDGTVFNVFPQEQLVKTLARSFRALAEEDPKAAGKAWAQLFIGSQSPSARLVTGGFGVGYEPGRGYRYGDLGSGMSLGERVLLAAPLPPIVQGLIRGDVPNPAENPVAGALTTGGFSTYQESVSQPLDRLAREKTGKGFFDLTSDERKAFIASDPEAQRLNDQSLKDSAERGSEGAQKLIASNEARAKLTEAQQADDEAVKKAPYPDAMKAWRERTDQRGDWLRAVQSNIYGDESREPKTALERYYAQIRANTIDATTGAVNWDMVNQWVKAQPETDRAAIEKSRATPSGTTELTKQFDQDKQKIVESGYWDVRDRLFPQWLKSKGFDANQTYEQFRTTLAERTWERVIQNGGSQAEARLATQKVLASILGEYDKVETKVESALITSNTELARLLIKWGYRSSQELQQQLIQAGVRE